MDLNRIATFVRVVEAGSFTAAAAHLALPTSSVSRSVSKLEDELGLVLLERTTRKIALTDAGRAYYERARDAVAGFHEATALANEAATEPAGIVYLAAPPELMGHLATTLGAFVRLHPKIQVEVITTARGAELVGSEVDLALCLGKLEDSGLIVRRLGSTTHRLYASRGYLERRGRPRSAADLARHDVVLYRGKAGRATWELAGPRGVERVDVRGLLSGDSFQFVMDAISGGHGIGLVPQQCLAHVSASSANALENVLPKHAHEASVQSLVHPSRHLPKRVALLRDHLVGDLAPACEGRRVQTRS